MNLNGAFFFYLKLIFINFEMKISEKACLIVGKSQFFKMRILNSTKLEYFRK